jgi:hypothetical protein
MILRQIYLALQTPMISFWPSLVSCDCVGHLAFIFSPSEGYGIYVLVVESYRVESKMQLLSLTLKKIRLCYLSDFDVNN